MQSRRPQLPAQVICQACGRALPRLGRQPITQELSVAWPDMLFIERRLLAGLVLGLDDRYGEWAMMDAARMCMMRYRQVSNALRRLVPCGWASRLSRGRYRLTELAVESVSAMVTGPRMTLTALQSAGAGHPRKVGRRSRAT